MSFVILILEDEWPAAQRLQALLCEVAPDARIATVLETGREAKLWLSQNSLPDLIISDIELADGLCFNIFEGAINLIPVVFTTAFNQYAIKAFEANAIDYLLKPIKREALGAAIAKWHALRHIALPQRNYQDINEEVIAGKVPVGDKKWLVRYGNKMLLIDSGEVSVYYSQLKSTFAVLASGKQYPMDESLLHIVQHLDTTQYFQINRNVVVKREVIAAMESRTKGRLALALNIDTGLIEDYHIVSAERSPLFRKWVSGKQSPSVG